jgi:predicted AAA+ superfamily ATPase
MENLIYLSYINTLKERLSKPSPLIQVLLGPRQVGKTTTILKFIKEHCPDQSLYVSADQVFNANSDWLYEQWHLALKDKKILVIDEIQKSHNWAETIKALYDQMKHDQMKHDQMKHDQTKKEGNHLSCILLGSSSLEIQKGLSESLTGRFQLLRAHHWNYLESKTAYGLTFEQYLQFGGYPGSYAFINSADWYDYVKNSIIATVVEKDILQFQTVKNPALFKQAFELLISYPAQEISYTKLLGQLQERGNVEIVKYYISLYEGAYLIKALEKFSNKNVLRKASSPKIISLAPCLSYLSIRDSYTPEERGRAFEALVGSQLLRTGEEVYYWRDGKDEVDYVLKQGRNLWAIEVKSGSKMKKNGLEKFKKNFPKAKIAIINSNNYFEFEEDPIKFLTGSAD